ncbi:MAG: hypothetical protein KME43_17380 [Myxacorys chilensis ATA2-1-KO14]|jgi:hypothetical protein|nr:hypothetical protein [Myxacorys chilensis ATA2-1-KO14]
MSSEVIVYVVYNASLKSMSCQEIIAIVQSKHPTWMVEGGEFPYFAIGLYDWAPVRISLNTHHSDVQEEAKEMADALALDQIPSSVISQVRQSNARFEICWDFTEDYDPVPETADVVFGIAKIIVDLTEGVALVNGSRLLSFDDDPWSQILP